MGSAGTMPALLPTCEDRCFHLPKVKVKGSQHWMHELDRLLTNLQINMCFLTRCMCLRATSGTQVNVLGKSKGTIEQLEPVVAWDPPPCYVSHFSKLREGYTAAKVGRQLSDCCQNETSNKPSSKAQPTCLLRIFGPLVLRAGLCRCWSSFWLGKITDGMSHLNVLCTLFDGPRQGYLGHGVQGLAIPQDDNGMAVP